MGKDSLTVTDNRTGKQYEIPIIYATYPKYGASIRTADLRQIKVSDDDFGLMGYDPAFMNTASCRSTVTFIDGDRGILRYRGYPIEQLAEKSTYLEVAYLLLHGELPTKPEYDAWVQDITTHTMLHENIKKFLDGFRHDAHPMGIFAGTVAALSTFYPEAKKVLEPGVRKLQIRRLIAKAITIGAYAHRHSQGLHYPLPDNTLSYTGNFMNMLWKMAETKYQPNPVLEKALDVLFILHADHEQNCSANAMRSIGSSQADPYVSVAGATGALYGPLHGGANQAVLEMLAQIGSKDHVPEFIKRVKAGEGKLMGFGHRVYKNYDPRAKIIRRVAEQVFEVTGRNRLLDIAMELERIALEDEYFVKRKLYPNVDFYSGIIYQAVKFPVDLFTVLFAIPRVSGWLAQWEELLLDQEQKISRPRQMYAGVDTRDYVPIGDRAKAGAAVGRAA